MALAKSNLSSRESGFSLVEVMIATGLMATAVVSLAQLFAFSTQTNISSRSTTYASVLAEQKLEELRALSWGYDTQALPLSDTSTNTAVTPETPTGGKGLSPSATTSLAQNTTGFVDYVDSFGNKLGTGENPPDNTAYIRRWSITPLPTNPNNTLIIQVLVTRHRTRGLAEQGNVNRLPDEARMITVRTRKAQ
jgi:type II secretory pathway pseudopilin PulG